jgi:hypothetical protein
MKNCLICQSGQDQATLNRIPISLQGKPWADVLVCTHCFETLGKDQVKELISLAVQEKSFEPSNILLADEVELAEETTRSGTLEIPVSPSQLRDKQSFMRAVAEKVGAKLWEFHRKGVSESLWSTSLTPDGEGGFIFSATFAKAQSEKG